MDKEIINRNSIEKLKYSLVISGVVILAIHLISPYIPLKFLWGFNFFRFISLPSQIILFIFGISVSISYFNKLISKFLIFIIESFNKFLKIFSTKTLYIIISFLFFLIFWILRSRRLYGDGVSAGYVIKNSVFLTSDGIYNSLFVLFHYLISNIYKTISGTDYPYGYFVTFAVGNCFLGSLFIIPLLLICKDLTNSIQRKFFIFSIILSQGAIQIFFGHVESYAIPLIGGILFILLSFYYIEDKVNIFLPAVSIILTSILKITTIQLYPALMLLTFLKMKKTKSLKSFYEFLLILLIPFSGILFYVLLAWKSDKLDLFISLVFSEKNFFPIINQTSPSHLYSIISLDYFTAFFNELALIFPEGILLAVFLLLFFRKQIEYKEPYFLFLLCMSLFCLTYNALSYPLLGPFRDWDKYSLTFLPITLFGAYLLNKYVIDDREFFSIALLILTFSLIHTVPWIVANNQKILSLKPVTEYVYVRDHLAGNRYIKSSIKSLRDKKFKNNDAYKWFGLATRFDVNLGGNNDSVALKYYNKAIQEEPDFSEARNNLALVYDRMEMYNKASNEFRRALKIDPKLAESHNNLGSLFADWMWWDKAYFHHKKATELNPNLAEAHNNLGIDYTDIGKYKEAVEEFKKALALNPKIEPSKKYLDIILNIIKR